MKKIYEWISKHKVWTIIICIAIFALPLIVVHALYKCHLGIDWLISDWESGDVLSYIAGFETLFGTALLGALTLWQNERFKEENDNSQDRLQKISEEQAKALEQILLMDQSSNVPLVDIKKSPKGDRFVNIELYIKKDGTASLKIFLTNITEYPIKDVHVQSLELCTYDIKYIVDKTANYSYNPHKGLPGHYDTHVAFKLLPIEYKDNNEHFENACPGHLVGETPQQMAIQSMKNQHFILKIVFAVENIYGKMIEETIICEFRGDYSSNPYEHSFSMWNKELRFEVVEESKNA